MLKVGKTHIAYVIHTLNPGGTERLVVDMALAFSASYRVSVICLDEPGVWAETLRSHGVLVTCLWRQPGFDLSIARRLAQWLKQNEVSLIHAHQCTPWFYAALSRLFFRRPRLLLEEHGRFYPESDNWQRRWVNNMIIRRLTHRFVAVSEDIRNRLVRYEGLNFKEIDVIYNGVSVHSNLSPSQKESVRTGLGFGPDDFVVGTVGRFDKIKNLPMLLGALRRAARRIPRIKGLIIGDGPEYDRISTLASESGMANRIKLTGYRSDARDLVQCFDLFVLASFSEGTSMALLEAMAAGVPTAVTAVGGNPEVVVDQVSGWVVPSDDTDALSSVICEAANDSIKAKTFAMAGQARFAKVFSFTKMVERYDVLYSEILPTAARN